MALLELDTSRLVAKDVPRLTAIDEGLTQAREWLEQGVPTVKERLLDIADSYRQDPNSRPGHVPFLSPELATALYMSNHFVDPLREAGIGSSGDDRKTLLALANGVSSAARLLEDVDGANYLGIHEYIDRFIDYHEPIDPKHDNSEVRKDIGETMMFVLGKYLPEYNMAKQHGFEAGQRVVNKLYNECLSTTNNDEVFIRGVEFASKAYSRVFPVAKSTFGRGWAIRSY